MEHKYYNMDDANLSRDYVVEIVCKNVNKAYARIKYYLDELCKIKNTDVEKILLYLQLESYCDCLLDLCFISRETYDKILSINYNEVIKHDS